MGYNPLVIGPSPNVLEKTIALIGTHVEDIIGVEVRPPPTDPGLFQDEFRADMQKYFPHLPLEMTNFYGYPKAGLFVEALQRTWCDLTRKSLLHAITTILHGHLHIFDYAPETYHKHVVEASATVVHSGYTN
jgi:hypothetical protein